MSAKKPRKKKEAASDSEGEEVTPKKKRAKKEPIPEDKRSYEEIYQKKTPLEHILLRPDSYVGSVEKQEQMLWVYEDEGMNYRSVSYVPGLYKIFDEILVNAADNYQRDNSMDTLKVTIDAAANTISVYNNGKGMFSHLCTPVSHR